MNRLAPYSRVVLLLLAAACGGGADSPVDPIIRQPGMINVSVRATGGDLDENGFEVVVGTAGTRKAIGDSGTVVFELPAGTHSVRLDGVAENCIVAGANQVSVTVAAGAVSEVTFAVECAVTGVEITTRTTGFNIPVGYQLLVNNPPARPIATNASLVVSRLGAGSHTVTLSVVSLHCKVVGASTLTVTVVNRTLVPVEFEIECGEITRLEKVAYTIMKFDGYAIGLVNPDGTGATELTSGRSPSWSPDGTKLVYSRTTCTEDYWYYYNVVCSELLEIMDPETRIVTSLANGTNGINGIEPAWSPLGNEIAFIRTAGTAARRLHILRLDGSLGGGPSSELVVQSAAIPFFYAMSDPAWSPDGQRLAFGCVIQQNNRDICVVRRDGTGLVRLTSGPLPEDNPTWSRDGRTIAFTSYDPGPGPQIGLIAAEGGAVTHLTSGLDPDWSRDGTKLALGRSNGGIFGIFVVDADGSNPKQLTTGANTFDPVWRP